MPAEPSPIPRGALRLGHRHIILPISENTTIDLSPQDAAGLWFPPIPLLIASRALGVGSRDGVAALIDGGGAGAFGKLSAGEDVVGLGLPAVPDVVVGRALGFGDGDDVVVFGCCCCLVELAFFHGGQVGDFVLDVEGLGDVGLVELLVFILIFARRRDGVVADHDDYRNRAYV
jgi:hypothetical protein